MSQEYVVNPDASAVLIPDVDAYLAGLEDGDEPMIDLGGGMVVPLRGVLDAGHEDIAVRRNPSADETASSSELAAIKRREDV